MSLYQIKPDVVDARQLQDTESVLTDSGPQTGQRGDWYVTRLVEGVLVGRIYTDEQFQRAFSKIAD